MEYKKITRLSMFLSLSILLSILESFLPIIGGIIPGMKLGLANIMIVIVLILYDFKDAFGLSILRVLFMGILRTGIFSTAFFFSLSGSLFSICAMAIVKKSNLSIIGVSIIGSIFHSIGQIIIAIFLLKLPNFIYYLPWMVLFSIATGSMIGYLAKQIITKIQND